VIFGFNWTLRKMACLVERSYNKTIPTDVIAKAFCEGFSAPNDYGTPSLHLF
jgi:hypothetical protein